VVRNPYSGLGTIEANYVLSQLISFGVDLKPVRTNRSSAYASLNNNSSNLSFQKPKENQLTFHEVREIVEKAKTMTIMRILLETMEAKTIYSQLLNLLKDESSEDGADSTKYVHTNACYNALMNLPFCHLNRAHILSILSQLDHFHFHDNKVHLKIQEVAKFISTMIHKSRQVDHFDFLVEIDKFFG
jgi:hypothetical protein